MDLDMRNINSLWASIMIEELVRSGVKLFCLAPGSRCTPLTLAVARRTDIQVIQHFDERGLGYVAVGYARATGQPAVVITTSGTAVANLLPAVVEARMDDLPLIVLAADRPPELRDIGANQTIDQVKIFGDHAAWFNDFPCPSTEMNPAFVLSTMDYAVHASRKGPVHVNCMYREPLAAVEDGVDYTSYLASLDTWLSSDQVYTRYDNDSGQHVASTGVELDGLGMPSVRGLLVAGPGLCAADYQGILALHTLIGWPIIADVTASVLRPHAVPHAELVFRNDIFLDDHVPDMVIHFGGRLVSKAYDQWISRNQSITLVLVTDRWGRFDPSLRADRVIHSAASMVCTTLSDGRLESASPSWLADWRDAGVKAGGGFVRLDTLSEPAVARCISELLPAEHGLFLGNSMPVRDMDVFAVPTCVAPTAANRGASGIDGTTSSAVGFGCGLTRPVTLLIGDLAVLHDLNALALLRDSEYPVTLVVINNDGGGIFSFLPVAADPAFEAFFGTPHGLGFSDAAGWARLSYHAPETLDEFVVAYKNAIGSGVSSVIEVRTDRGENVDVHRAVLS